MLNRQDIDAGRKSLTPGKRRRLILLATFSGNPNEDSGRTVSFRAEGKCHSHSKQDGLGVRSIDEDQFLGERRQFHRCNQHAGRYKRPQGSHKPARPGLQGPSPCGRLVSRSGPEAAPGAQQVHAEQAYIYFTARVKCLPSGEIPRSCYSRGTAILLGSPFTARVKSCRGVRVGRWVLKTTTRRRRAQVRSGWQSQSIKKCVSMQTNSRPILRRRCI